MRLKLKIAYHAVNMLILHMTHYSKSQIFVQKFNFDKTPTFSRVFNANFFWQFFSWNQSCQQLKCPIPQHFHEFFTPKNRQFSWEIKVGFLDKKWRFGTVCMTRTLKRTLNASSHMVWKGVRVLFYPINKGCNLPLCVFGVWVIHVTFQSSINQV